MSDDDTIACYVRFVAGGMCELPLADAVTVLRGALCIAGDHAAMTSLRRIYIQLRESADQLDLIASPQLKLPLEGGSHQ